MYFTNNVYMAWPWCLRVSSYAPNFYSFLNDVNPHYKQQWDWMTEQLQLAEQQGEKAGAVFVSCIYLKILLPS